MKRSAKITLVLISSISLIATGCSSQQATKKEMYQNLDDCAQEWGSSAYCQPTTPSNPYSYYLGPDYYISKGRVYYFPPGTDREQVLGSNTGFFLAHKNQIAATQQNTTGSSTSGGSDGNWSYSSGSGTTTDEYKPKSIGQVNSTKTIARGGFGKSGSVFGRGA